MVLLAAEDSRDSPTDPEYWWNKKEYYEAEYKKIELERAKRSADAAARDVAYFPACQALLESENYRESAADPGYLLRKQKDYRAKYRKLKKEFWARWRNVHLDGGESLSKALNNLGPTNYYDAKTKFSTFQRCNCRGPLSLAFALRSAPRFVKSRTTASQSLLAA